MTDYSKQAAEFIAAAERHAELGLPHLPDDPAEAAAMHAAGYDVLARVVRVSDIAVAVSVAGEPIERWIHPDELAAALGIPAQELAGMEFITVLRETPDTGVRLSRFRRLPDAVASRRVTEDMVTRALEVLESGPADRDLVRRALEDALLAPGAAAVTAEYAESMSDGYHLWKPSPYNEDRVDVVRESGGHVFRRSVIVVDDWAEVTGP